MHYRSNGSFNNFTIPKNKPELEYYLKKRTKTLLDKLDLLRNGKVNNITDIRIKDFITDTKKEYNIK